MGNLGYNSVGGSENLYGLNVIFGCGDEYTMTEDGALQTAHIYGFAGYGKAQVAVYEGTTLIAETSQENWLSPYQWNDLPFSSGILLSGHSYRIVWNSSSANYVKHDVSATANLKQVGRTFSSGFPNPISWADVALQWRPSIYVTYGAVPPTVRTDPATNISSGNAQLNGTLLTGADGTTVAFEAGEGADPAGWTWSGGSSSRNAGQAFSAILTGLAPNKTYYFRARAGDPGSYVYGSVRSFSTAQYPTKPLTRVAGIHGRFVAGQTGKAGVYLMELLLGGLETEWMPPFTKWQPTVGEGGIQGEAAAAKPKPVFDPTKDIGTDYLVSGMNVAARAYGRFMTSATPEQKTALFGKPNPTLQEFINKLGGKQAR